MCVGLIQSVKGQTEQKDSLLEEEEILQPTDLRLNLQHWLSGVCSVLTHTADVDLVASTITRAKLLH